MSCDKSCEQHNGRRTFCRTCIGAMTAASAAMVGYPVASFVISQPSRIGEDKPLEVPLDQLVQGQARYETYRGLQVIILSMGDGPRVFSASCPHLGCAVNWVGTESLFRCPCHGAVFNPDGSIVSGPVNAPLTSIPFEIKDGKLIVSA